MPDTHLINAGKNISLRGLSTSGKDFHSDREAAEKEFKAIKKQLAQLQNCLYAEGKQKLLVVLQAMDAGGKDSTIRKVFSGINPQGVRVTSFKSPSKEELAHDYLWRIHKHVPAKGMIGVFNRSHYEDVLVVRVDNIVPESVWSKRFEQINHFEQMLHESGTNILKFFLHISKDEQKKRFQDRLDVPEKRWKFAAHDLVKRQQWDEYQTAFEDMINRCTTDFAPWHVIPADNKWYRNLAIGRTILHEIKKMDPQFPNPEENLDRFQID